MYIIGLSGPPSSGKDTLGDLIAKQLNREYGLRAATISLSTPMRHAVYALLGVEYTLAHYEMEKDTLQSSFNGRSIRQEMIELSERHVKPRLGQGFWARSITNRMNQMPTEPPKFLIVTDMGFQAEAEVFQSEVGSENCVWIQIYRPGKDFSKDSRSYVGGDMNNHVCNNDEDLDGLRQFATDFVVTILDSLGWEV